MCETVSIIYRDFWDVPRIFVTRYAGKQLVFDCPFDEEMDDYPHHYEVYLLPDIADDQLKTSSWVGLVEQAELHLGKVDIADIKFDTTKRKTVNLSAISWMLEDNDISGAGK